MKRKADDPTDEPEPKRQKSLDWRQGINEVDELDEIDEDSAPACIKLKDQFTSVHRLIASCLTTDSVSPHHLNVSTIVCGFADMLMPEIEEHLRVHVQEHCCERFWTNNHPSATPCDFCELGMIAPRRACERCDSTACFYCMEDMRIAERDCGHMVCGGCCAPEDEKCIIDCLDCFKDPGTDEVDSPVLQEEV